MGDADKINHTEIIINHSGILASLQTDVNHIKQQQNVLFDLLSKMDCKLDSALALEKRIAKIETCFAAAIWLGGIACSVIGGIAGVIADKLF
jgi:histidyl-tRNA synthetase